MRSLDVTSRVLGAVVCATGAAMLLSLTGCTSAATTATAGSVPPSASEPVTGVMGVEDYPVTMRVPEGVREVSGAYDHGSRVFEGRGVTLIVTALRSVDGRPAEDLPEDVSKFIAEEREDLVVTEAADSRVDGRSAESFTVKMAPGAPRIDLWCPIEERLCWKLPEGGEILVRVAESSTGPVWFDVEYPIGEAEAARATFDEFLAGVTIG